MASIVNPAFLLQILDKCPHAHLEEGCCICFDKFEIIQDIALFPQCGHICCSVCASRFADISTNPFVSCPLCRTNQELIGFRNFMTPIPGWHANSYREISAFNTTDADLPLPPPKLQRQITNAFQCNYNFTSPPNSNLASASINDHSTIMPHLKPPLLQLTINELTSVSNDVDQSSTLIKCVYDTTIEDDKTIGAIIVESPKTIITTKGTTYILMIDDSGSMYTCRNNAKKSTKELIKCLRSIDRVVIIYFSSYARQLAPLQNATSINKTRMYSLIDDIQLGESTNYMCAFELASKIIEDALTDANMYSYTDQIITIFMSDGCPDTHTDIDTLEVANYYLQCSNANTIGISSKLYVASFGAEADSKNLICLLKEDEIFNYHHVKVGDFEPFLLKIQMNTNTICGRDAELKFKNILISNSLATSEGLRLGDQSICDNTTISFVVILPSEPIEITLTYTDIAGEIITIDSIRTDLNKKIIKNFYNYRKTIREITNLSYSKLQINGQLAIAQELKDNATSELYGNYYMEIIETLEYFIQSKINQQDITKNNEFIERITSSETGQGLYSNMLNREVSEGLQSV